MPAIAQTKFTLLYLATPVDDTKQPLLTIMKMPVTLYFISLMFCTSAVAQSNGQAYTKIKNNNQKGGCPVYTFTGSGNWDNPANWSDSLIPPPTLPPCFEIMINPDGNGECLLNIPFQMISPGGKITVAEGKKFVVPGKVNIF